MRNRIPQPNRIYHSDGRVTTFSGGGISTNNPAQQSSAPLGEYHRIDAIQPTNPISVVSGVIVPILQTLITAILWACAVPIVHMLIAEYTSYDFNHIPLIWLVLIVVLIVQWSSLLREWRTLIRPEVSEESFVNLGDAIEPINEYVKIQVNTNEGRKATFLDLPISNAKLATFTMGLQSGGSTAESAWVGVNQLFSRSEYVGLRDALISRGFAVWNSQQHHDRGWRLSAKGHSVFNELSNKFRNEVIR